MEFRRVLFRSEIVLACLQRADRDGPERLAGGILDRDAGVGRTFGNFDMAIDRAGGILDGGRARCERIFAYPPGRGRKLDLVHPFQNIARSEAHTYEIQPLMRNSYAVS